MPKTGGGYHMSYKPNLFSWLRHKLIVVEDWPYNGADFRGDPNMPLPEEEEFDDGGQQNNFDFFIFYCF